MKYYKVIAKGFTYDYQTAQDSFCILAEIGQKFKVLDSKLWFEQPDGKWRLTINWPDIIDLGLENKQLEQYKHIKTKYPKYIERIDDGELFSLNKDGETYSLERMKKDFPENLANKHTYNTLMVTYKGCFRVD